jgi:hypothetical protein
MIEQTHKNTSKYMLSKKKARTFNVGMDPCMLRKWFQGRKQKAWNSILYTVTCDSDTTISFFSLLEEIFSIVVARVPCTSYSGQVSCKCKLECSGSL